MATCDDNKRSKKYTKRPTTKIRQANYVYIKSKSNFKEQLNNCKNLLSGEHNEIYLHCLGNAISKGINLALKIVENSKGTLDFEVNTSTVKVYDDSHPLHDDDDFEVNKRLNSCLHIRIFKKTDITFE